MGGRKTFSSSRKSLECLCVWEQLIQNETLILWQAWKQVASVRNTRCATGCFCVKTAISPGLYHYFAFANKLSPLGLAGCVLQHLNLEDWRGESLTCKGISALLWTIFPSSSPLPKPCATIWMRLVKFICWISRASLPDLGEKTMSVWSLHIDWGGEGVALPCRYYGRTTNPTGIGPSQPSKSQ